MKTLLKLGRICFYLFDEQGSKNFTPIHFVSLFYCPSGFFKLLELPEKKPSVEKGQNKSNGRVWKVFFDINALLFYKLYNLGLIIFNN